MIFFVEKAKSSKRKYSKYSTKRLEAWSVWCKYSHFARSLAKNVTAFCADFANSSSWRAIRLQFWGILIFIIQKINLFIKDEYDRSAEYSEEREKNFRKVLLEERGFEIIDVKADGACMFRSVADQVTFLNACLSIIFKVYGDESMHDVIRHRCCDYMALNADYFRNWVTENFEDYISRKRLLHTHGNHIELQAMSELYLRKFEIFEYRLAILDIFAKINSVIFSPIANQTFDCSEPSHYTPIRLSYHNGNHYNSIRNPLQASIGT